MYKLDNLSSNARQNLTWISPSGERAILSFEYRENCLGWYLGIKYGENVNYNNIRITTTHNLLRAYNTYIPYGLKITTLDGLEPMAIDDFSSGYANIYVLTNEECIRTESEYYGKV